MSGFSSLGLGAGALSAAQRALDVTGQNISNASTAGYSRQRVDQVAQGASVVPAMYARSDAAGGGVQVVGVDRIRDEFLEARAQAAHAAQGSLTSTQQTYADIETTFGEPGDTGLQSQLSSFWSAWHDVANDPGSAAPRQALLAQAGAVAGTFNDLSSRLTQQWADSREQLGATVTDVNAMATDVAKLNQSIRAATVAGMPANELSDQRDALVLKLGEAIGAVATAGPDGVVNVSVGGSPLVTGERTRALQLSGPTAYPGATGSVGVTWAADGSAVAVSSGTVDGMLTGVNATLPSYLKSLDDIAGSLSSAVAAQQGKGYDLSGKPGAALFTGTTAGTLAVAITDPSGIAASTAPPPALDGDNALDMGNLTKAPGGADATYRSLIVQLGVQAQSVNRRTDVQAGVVGQLDDARQSVSGVSLDEEMTNLVSYQHSYEAAAKFVTTIDSTLDTLIHMVQ